MSTTTSSLFSGNSRFASDFSSLIDRATNIASLPMTQMQATKVTLSNRASALSSLDAKIGAFQAAVAGLSDATGSGSYKASASDASVASPAISGKVSEGSYSIEVTSMGSSAQAMSKDPAGAILKVSDPAMQTLSPGNSFRLYLDGDTTGVAVNPTGNTLSALVSAINNASSDLQASVVNVGGSSGADYRLSIQGRTLGTRTISLKDGNGNALLDQLATGAPVTYKINGGSTISNNTRTITLTPGLTVNLLKQSATDAACTITVARQSASISSALGAFASAYNATMDELDLSRGEGSGALKGDSIISTVAGALRNVAGHSMGKDGLASLTSLGLTFDSRGRLSFDSTAFDKATTGRFDDLATFLGSTTGGGFLSAATGALNSLENTQNGYVKTAILSATSQISVENSAIAAQQERVDKMKSDMQARMAAADALIASLEQKVGYVNDLFASMRAASTSY